MPGHDHSGDKQKPLVVFVGRSNVGKSSTIRALTGKKVRVGKSPGSTTREYMVDHGPITIVDVPGFGFMAGTSKKNIEETKTAIIQNLERWGEQIILAILVIDISLFSELVERWEKRGEIPIDIEFYTFLSEITKRVIVVANKSDKLRKKERFGEIEYLRERLRHAVPDREPTIVPISAAKKRNISTLKKLIEESLSDGGITMSW
ncbi:MAG: putative GTP-binding protein EngB [Candidatus Thorarchaeota archaeon]|nr:MAG: putative GTP-binding protein EngB [Candidatus Thorarchaeota archaeon]